MAWVRNVWIEGEHANRTSQRIHLAQSVEKETQMIQGLVAVERTP
jgi:hypothetical protein